MQNSVAFLVPCTSQTFGGPRPLGPCLPRYHTKFGRSMSNRMGVGKGHKDWRTMEPVPCEWGRGCPLETTVLHVLPYRIWLLYVKPYRRR